LALLFYGGIAGGVLFASLAPGKASSSLNSYLFGSLSTVATGDLWALGILAVSVLVILAIFGRELFAVCLDPDIAQVQGIRVRAMSTLMAVLAAIVVVIGMRVVGLLLVSAIMIVPVAAAQQLTRSFRSTAVIAVIIGLISSIAGLAGSFYIEVPPGPAIVILALACFAVLAIIAVPIRRRRKELA
jgi:zinc transport system permease protein